MVACLVGGVTVDCPPSAAAAGQPSEQQLQQQLRAALRGGGAQTAALRQAGLCAVPWTTDEWRTFVAAAMKAVAAVGKLRIVVKKGASDGKQIEAERLDRWR